jgi:hypothetical protein
MLAWPLISKVLHKIRPPKVNPLAAQQPVD